MIFRIAGVSSAIREEFVIHEYERAGRSLSGRAWAPQEFATGLLVDPHG
jgi:hypothetical protein